MHAFIRMWRRLAYLFTGDSREQRLQDEMRFHLQMKAEAHVAEGMPRDEAELAARRSFGNSLVLREDARDAWGWRWLDSIGQDVRYAVRVMRHNKGFAAVAVLTLALGIGANTTIFTVINAALVRPLPYNKPGDLVTLDETAQQTKMVWSQGISAYDYLALRAGNHTLEEFGVYTAGNFALTGIGEPRRVQSAEVTATVFRTLGTQPLMGRWFSEDDEIVGKNRQAIVGYGLWRRTFGDRDPIGSTITLDGEPYTIVGVMPPRFEFPIEQEQVEIWTPVAFDAQDQNAKSAYMYHGIGRMKAGVTGEQVKADLEVVTKRLKHENGEHALDAVSVERMKETMVAPIRGSLLMAGGAVLCVLLIAGANLAGLLLARASSRQREISVRLAMGAGRPRLVRQLLTESVLLGILGGGLGLALSAWTTRLLVSVKPPDLPLVGDVTVDANVVLFTIGASVLSGLVFGLVPALQVSKTSISHTLNEVGSRVTGHRSRSRVRRTLVGVEVALSLVLLCGAGLMIRTLMKLRAVDPGFRPESVLTAELLLPSSKYNENAQRDFARTLMERLKAQPGIMAAGATTNLPMAGGGMIFLSQLPNGKRAAIYFHSITPGYFAAMNMPVLRGRDFTGGDSATSPKVAIISESAAKDMFPDQDPLGKTMKSAFTKEPPTIVGIVRDVHGVSLTTRTLPEMYLPFEQKPWPFLRLAVRGQSSPSALAAIVREQVRAIDKNEPVDKVRTMDAVVGQSMATQRFYMLLLASFATVAVCLSLVGIYGVVSFETAQRTHEIGIRIALGARPGQIFHMIVGQGVTPVFVGLLFGVAGAFAATKVLKSLVFGITTRDPFTFVVVPVVLVAAAVLATIVPARRAVKVDPIVALRYE